MLATLLLASGTPMLTAGDEIGRTQQGNNNAYCQDNEISWVDWSLDDQALELRESVSRILHLRGEHPQLRAPHFLRPADPEHLDAGQVAWFGAEGDPLDHESWMDPSRHLLAMLRPAIRGRGGAEHLLVIFSTDSRDVPVQMPRAPWPQGTTRVLLDTALERQDDLPASPVLERTVIVRSGSVVVLGIAADGAEEPSERLS